MDEHANDLPDFPLESWPQDIKDDFASCKTDAERRTFLLREGYKLRENAEADSPNEDNEQSEDESEPKGRHYTKVRKAVVKAVHGLGKLGKYILITAAGAAIAFIVGYFLSLLLP